MKITHLELKNFRLYDYKLFSFINDKEYITGANGTGKTSVLEAINLCLTTKSFRTNDYHQVIKKDCDFAKIKLVIDNDDEIKLIITNKTKALYLNNSLVKKLSTYIGKYPVVSFSKRDYEQFFSSPSFRRNYFDFEISKISPSYLNELITFNKLLKKRNELLKTYDEEKLPLFRTITEMLISSARKIINERESYVNKLNNLINNYFPKFYYPVIKLNYLKNINQNSLDKLNDYTNDIKYGLTLYGPQKDDYELTFNNYNISSYQSSGEQKISLFGLKLVIAKLLEENNKNLAIILIDDIFSELDENNIEKIKKIINNLSNQVFITTTINLK